MYVEKTKSGQTNPSPKNKRPDAKKSQKEVKNKSTNDRKKPTT